MTASGFSDNESLFDVDLSSVSATASDDVETLFVQSLPPGAARPRPFAAERWTIPSPTAPASETSQPVAMPASPAQDRSEDVVIDLTTGPPLRFRRKVDHDTDTDPTTKVRAPIELVALTHESTSGAPVDHPPIPKLTDETLAITTSAPERVRFEVTDEPTSRPRRRRLWRWLIFLLALIALIGGLVFAGVKNSRRADSAVPIQLRQPQRDVLIIPAGSTLRTTVAIRNVTSGPLTVVGIDSNDGAVALVAKKPPVLPAGSVSNLTLDVTPPPRDPTLHRSASAATSFVMETVAQGASSTMSLPTLITVPGVSPLQIEEKSINGTPTKISALGERIVVADADGTLLVFDLNGQQIYEVAVLRQLAKPGRRVTGLATKDKHLYVAYSDWASVIGNVDRTQGAIADVTIDPKTLNMKVSTLVYGLPSGPGNMGLGEIGVTADSLVAAIGMVDGDATGLAGTVLRIDIVKAARSAPNGIDGNSDDEALSVFVTGLGSGAALSTTSTSVIVTDTGPSDSLRIVESGAFLGVPNPIRKERNAVTNGLGSFAGVGPAATFVNAPRTYQPPMAWLGGNQNPGAVLVVGGSVRSPVANRILVTTRRGLRSVAIDGTDTQMVGTVERFGTVSDLAIGPQGQLLAVDPVKGRLLIG
jgi:hypothetical protein